MPLFLGCFGRLSAAVFHILLTVRKDKNDLVVGAFNRWGAWRRVRHAYHVRFGDVVKIRKK